MNSLSPSPSVEIQLLGAPVVLLDGREQPELLRRRHRSAVLAIVATEGVVSRDRIAELVWPTKKRGRKSLSQEVYALRQLLGQHILRSDARTIRLSDEVVVDVPRFKRAIEEGRWSSAVELDDGPFLHDFSGPPSDEFSRWADVWRSRLDRSARQATAERVSELRARGRLTAALEVASRRVTRDPLDDGAQHDMIELLHLTGSTAEALSCFEEYRRALKADGTVPLERTLVMVQRIRSATSPATPPAPDTLTFGGAEIRTRREGTGFAPSITPGSATAVITAVAMVLLLLTWGVWWGPSEASLRITDGALDPRRVAVLYFSPDGPRGDSSGLAQAVTAELIVSLDQLTGVDVVPIAGVRRFRDRDDLSHAEIGLELGAGLLVEGVVQEIGAIVQVAGALVNVSSGETTAFQVRGSREDMIPLLEALGDRVTAALRPMVGAQIREAEARVGTESIESWFFLRRAEQLMGSLPFVPVSSPSLQRPSVGVDLHVADSLLAEARRSDPSWSAPLLAQAWLGLAEAKRAEAVGRDGYEEHIDRGVAYATELARRDSTLAAAFEARGTMLWHRSRARPSAPRAVAYAQEAKRDLRRALELDPLAARAWAGLSRALQYEDSLAAAYEAARQAVEVDAFLEETPTIIDRLYRIASDLERPDQAERWCAVGSDRFPTDRRFLECHLRMAAWGPRPPIPSDSAALLFSAIERLDGVDSGAPTLTYRHVHRIALLAAASARAGERSRARELLDTARQRVNERPQDLARPFGFDEARVLLALGDTTPAIEAVRGYINANPQFRDYVLRHRAFVDLPIESSIDESD